MADIFTVVYPIVLVTQLFGLGPFLVDQKKKRIEVFIPGLIYSITMLVAFVGNAAFLAHTRIVHGDKKVDSYISLTSDIILISCGIVGTISCILFTIIQRQNYVHVVRKFYKVGLEMIKINERIQYQKLLKHIYFQLFCLTLALIILFFHTIMYLKNYSIGIYISYMYAWFTPKIFNFYMEYQFITGVILLKSHFDLVNKFLEKLDESEKNKNDPNYILNVVINDVAWMEGSEKQAVHHRTLAQSLSAWEGKYFKVKNSKIWSTDNSINMSTSILEKIKVTRKIHKNLCEIKEYLNTAFSIQMLTSVAQSFIFITADLYLIFSALTFSTDTTPMMLSYPILWASLHSIELLTIVISCTQASKSVRTHYISLVFGT